MKLTVILRVAGAILASIAAVFVLLIAVELYSSVVHPLPADSDDTYEAMCAHVANYPDWVLATVVPMWAFIAFFGTWLAGWLGNRFAAIFVALLLLAGLLSNLAMLPYPTWFKILQGLAIVVAVLVGYWLATLRRPAVSLGVDATSGARD